MYLPHHPHPTSSISYCANCLKQSSCSWAVSSLSFVSFSTSYPLFLTKSDQDGWPCHVNHFKNSQAPNTGMICKA